jgi:hypothetical protein
MSDARARVFTTTMLFAAFAALLRLWTTDTSDIEWVRNLMTGFIVALFTCCPTAPDGRSSTCTAWRCSARSAGFSRPPRGSRSNSGPPARCSSEAIRRDTADCV